MTDRPILFSGPMVRAILDGTKTQTRRIAKFVQPNGSDWHIRNGYGGMSVADEHAVREYGPDYAPYAIGDRLWVRESWFVDHVDCQDGPYQAPEGMSQQELIENGFLHFAATDDPNSWEAERPRWKPSIHMPRWASRLTLTVTDVRVERLQDISEADAKAEGCRAIGSEDCPDPDFRSFVWDFNNLWNHINGPEAWDANPWVVAVSFSAEQRNIDQ